MAGGGVVDEVVVDVVVLLVEPLELDPPEFVVVFPLELEPATPGVELPPNFAPLSVVTRV